MLTVRLRDGYKARLQALAQSDGYSVAAWLETWVELAEAEASELQGRRNFREQLAHDVVASGLKTPRGRRR